MSLKWKAMSAGGANTGSRLCALWEHRGSPLSLSERTGGFPGPEVSEDSEGSLSAEKTVQWSTSWAQ